MALIKIEVVHSQAKQRGIELLENLGARESLVRAAHGEVQLGGQYVTLARDARQGFAQNPFGRSPAIAIRGVDEGNCTIERTMDTRDGNVLCRAFRKIEPRAKRDFGYDTFAAAQRAIFHRQSPAACADGRTARVSAAAMRAMSETPR